MNKILQSEHLKQKHTFQKSLIYLAPLVSIAIAFVLMGGYYIQKSAYNWWYTLILPGSFTMICSFIISNDRKIQFNGLFSVMIDKQRIWYSKIILSTIYLGLSCLVFFLAITTMGLIFGTAIQVQNSLLASIMLFVTFSWQIPVLMYLAMKFSTGLTIIISILCNFVGAIILALTPIWWIPFAIPSKLMCYVIRVMPNGLSVEAGAYPFDIKVTLIGVLVTVTLYIVMSYLTSKWFGKQEI
ncbi:MAG: lantibiotic immunity ABC transporter MutE/EpiE family permease subunit [Romboutsia sp.]